MGKEQLEELKSSNKKIKVKLNSRYSNTGANLLKIENLYQVSGNEERQEIQMDEPRLKIFRFKHMKTSLEEERSTVTMMQSEGKSSKERRGASKKAQNRYETKTEESDSLERMSNLDNELNQIFYEQPKMESTREIYGRESKNKSNEREEDVLSNS